MRLQGALRLPRQRRPRRFSFCPHAIPSRERPGEVGALSRFLVMGGVDIFDAHSGALRLRIFLPQQFMTDVDALHGSFLAVDENGQRLLAITSSDGTAQNAALTIVSLLLCRWALARFSLRRFLPLEVLPLRSAEAVSLTALA